MGQILAFLMFEKIQFLVQNLDFIESGAYDV